MQVLHGILYSRRPRREVVAEAVEIRFGEEAGTAVLPLLERIEDDERLRELLALAINCPSPDEFRAGLGGPATAGKPGRRRAGARNGEETGTP
jgi:hypothetical protein